MQARHYCQQYKNMKLIIGLGNPGEKYASTRHNAGFIALCAFAERKGAAEFKKDEMLKACYAKIRGAVLLLPQTFMNDSGSGAAAAAKIFKTPPENILVIHDDIDLPFGTYKLQIGRGAAGHHGVESIIQALVTKKFWRLRIGVNPEKKPKNVPAFILKNFSKVERTAFNSQLDTICNVIQDWIV